MAMEKTFVEKIQDYLKGVDGMVPYMFPMIGENYENAKRKILVVIDFVRKYACNKDMWPRPENISYDELCTKDDNIRGAWENMRYKNKKLRKILKEKFLEIGCDIEDVILTSFSRWPSDAKKFEHGINEIEVLGRFPDYVNDVPYTFLQTLIEYSNPDEVWFLGEGTERLVLKIPKYYKKEDYDDIREKDSLNGESNWEKRYKKRDKKDLKYVHEKVLLDEFSQGKFKCVTIEITKPEAEHKDSKERIFNKFEKNFNTLVQGEEFTKLSKELQVGYLKRFENHIQDVIKTIEAKNQPGHR